MKALSWLLLCGFCISIAGPALSQEKSCETFPKPGTCCWKLEQKGCEWEPGCLSDSSLPTPYLGFLTCKNAPFYLSDDSLLADAYSEPTPPLKPLCYQGDSCSRQLLRVQALYDGFAWDTFIRLNWPLRRIDTVNDAAFGEASFFTEGIPWWISWPTAQEIFEYKGSRDSFPYYGKRRLPESFVRYDGLPVETPGRGTRLPENQRSNDLFARPWTRTPRSSMQGRGHVLRDQSGRPVFYETIVNRRQTSTINNKKYRFHSLEGQIAWLSGIRLGEKPDKSRFPQSAVDGEVILKAAWKILGKGDIASRFVKRPGLVPCEADLRPGCRDSLVEVNLGLVGFHIMVKAKSSVPWIFATFEHVDNLEVDAVDRYHEPGRKPLFRDEARPAKPVNVPDSAIQGTQVSRLLPIPSGTMEMNRQVRQALQGSVIANYQLVGTQFSANDAAFMTPDAVRRFPKEDTGIAAVYPRYLANTVIETFQQTGNAWDSPEAPKRRVFKSASCIHCHMRAGFVKDTLIPPGGLAYVTVEGTAGFTFLFQQFARMDQVIEPDTVKPSRPNSLHFLRNRLTLPLTPALKLQLTFVAFPKACLENGMIPPKVKVVDSGTRILIAGKTVNCSMELDAQNKLRIYKY